MTFLTTLEPGKLAETELRVGAQACRGRDQEDEVKFMIQGRAWIQGNGVGATWRGDPPRSM